MVLLVPEDAEIPVATELRVRVCSADDGEGAGFAAIPRRGRRALRMEQES